MKKLIASLVMLILTAALVTTFAGAVVSDDDVGFYLRFDSQEVIDTYTKSEWYNVSYDPDNAALFLETTKCGPNLTWSDPNFWVYLPEGVSLSEYPYIRWTYYIPEILSNGQAPSTHDKGMYFYGNVQSDGALIENGVGEYSVGSWQRRVVSWSGYVSTVKDGIIKDLRLDIPSGVYPGDNLEFYLYDVGLFKTAEAAYSYNPEQENYVIDMTKPDSYELFPSVKQGTLTYDSDEQATVFTHLYPDDPDTYLDGVIDGYKVPANEFFSPQNYPYASTVSKTNQIAAACWFLNYVITGGDLRYNVNSSSVGDECVWSSTPDVWEVLFKDMRDSGDKTTFANSVALTTLRLDPINTSNRGQVTPGETYRAFKYIAYYATEEEAKKQSQSTPDGIVAEAPDSADGMGTISGLTTDMEYRTSYEDEWTAVTSDSMEATPGATYYIRYAATDEANPSYAAKVGVPIYWNLQITGVKSADGSPIEDAGISGSLNNWEIKLPSGTDLDSVSLDYTLECSAPDSYTAYRQNCTQTEITRTYYLTANSEIATSMSSGIRPDPIAALDVTNAVAEGQPIRLYAFGYLALHQPIDIEFSVDMGDITDDQVVEQIIAALESTEVKPEDLQGVTDSDQAAQAIAEAVGLNSVLVSYTGASAEVVVTDFKAATHGDAQNRDGVNGSLSYSFKASYNDAQKTGDPKQAEIKATKFRVLLMFNDQEFADTLRYTGIGKFKLGSSGKPPVEYDEDEGRYYLHFEATEDMADTDTYFEIGNTVSKENINSGNYTAIVDADEYPYVVFSYRSKGKLPSGGASTQQIYFESTKYILANTYQNVDGVESGAYMGYTWYKNAGFYSTIPPLFPQNTLSFTQTVMDFKNGTAGLQQASNGYSETGSNKYNTPGVHFPWTGDIVLFRANVGNGTATINTGDYLDLEYIAFFATAEDAAEFDGMTAEEITRREQHELDGLKLDSVSGSVVSNTETGNKYVSEKVAELLADKGYSDIVVNDVSYSPFDLEQGSSGEYVFTLTVKKGDVLGDRAVYDTQNITLEVTVPTLDVQSAVAALESMSYSAIGIHTNSGAVANIQRLIKNVTDTYAGYDFDVEITDSAEGSYTFTVKVTHEGQSATTKPLTLTVEEGNRLVLDFGNPILAKDVVFDTSSAGKTTELVTDPAYLGGSYQRFNRLNTSTEFNLQIKPGTGVIPAIEDLSVYRYLVYKYKAPGHERNQLYYWLSGVGGANYFDFGPQVSANEWNTHIYELSTLSHNGAAWGGVPTTLRFDFFRWNTDADVTLELDYIAFFATLEEAQAFAECPELDSDLTPEQLAEEYASEIAQLSDVPSIMQGADPDAAIKNLLSGISENAYYTITDVQQPTGGSNGQVKFVVYFADSALNGNVTATDELTMEIVAPTGKTTAELRADDNALRFKTVLDKAWMDNAQQLSYGTLIVPTKILGDGALTLDNADALNVAGEKIFAQDEQSLTYTGVLTGIPEQYNGVDITARAYVKYTVDGSEVVVYLDACTASLDSVS